MLEFITAVILLFSIFNMLRLAVFMLAADIYDVRKVKNDRHTKQNKVIRNRKLPYISILIPAFNEELTIEGTVVSVIKARYRRKEIFVIDDGSTDKTSDVVNKLIARYPRSKLTLIQQKNAGKGAALNSGIARASGSLIMVLDADSTIAVDALKNSVKYFEDKKVKAIASSVGLHDNGSWLGLIQIVEYLLSYRMKRSLTTLNIEYIVGGVGSVYRASTLKQVAGYRHNTITEDIDLSMKVIARGNKSNRVQYASDVHTKTEPVHSLKELINQRYRWKLGRLQSFMRYKHLFFSTNKKYSKILTWFQLPYAIFGELYLLMEPIFIGTLLYVTFIYSDSSSLPIAIMILSTFIIFNILATDQVTTKAKLALIYLIPVIFFLLPILAYVEFVSLLKSIKNWRRISPNYKASGAWVHVKRKPTIA